MEYDRATGSSADERVAGLIAAEAAVAVTEPVVMEVLAGARTDELEGRPRRLRAHGAALDRLARVVALDLDPASLRPR